MYVHLFLFNLSKTCYQKKVGKLVILSLIHISASSSTRSSLLSSTQTIIRTDIVTGTVMDTAAMGMAMDTVMARRSRISVLVLFLWGNQG